MIWIRTTNSHRIYSLSLVCTIELKVIKHPCPATLRYLTEVSHGVKAEDDVAQLALLDLPETCGKTFQRDDMSSMD